MEPNKEYNPLFNIRNLVFATTGLCMILFLLPAFKFKFDPHLTNAYRVSMHQLGWGVGYWGNRTESVPFVLICFLFLLAILVLLFLNLKKVMRDRPCAIAVAATASADLFVWLFIWAIFKSEYSYTFHGTFWFALNLLFLMSIIALSILVVIKKLQFDGWLPFGSGVPGGALAQGRPAAAVPQAGEAPVGACPSCGSPIKYGSRFCAGCGATIPQSMIDEAEKKAAAAPAVTFCPSCGAKLNPDAAFCASCGLKLK